MSTSLVMSGLRSGLTIDRPAHDARLMQPGHGSRPVVGKVVGYQAQRRLPCQFDDGVRTFRVELPRGELANMLWWYPQLHASGQRLDLRLASTLEKVDLVKRVRSGRAAGEQAVVAQDHRLVRTEIGNQAFTLAQVKRNAFIVVVTQLAVELQRMLTDRQQPFLLRRYSGSRRRMRMHDERDVLARHVNRRVDRKTGLIDDEELRRIACTLVDDLALVVDLH